MLLKRLHLLPRFMNMWAKTTTISRLFPFQDYYDYIVLAHVTPTMLRRVGVLQKLNVTNFTMP